MVIYEVNLAIDNDIYPQFKLWIKKHINDMLQFPGFVQASLLKPELNDIPEERKLTIQYQLRDKDDLEKYLTEYATNMRAEGIKQFGNQFSATRKVFTVEEVISK